MDMPVSDQLQHVVRPVAGLQRLWSFTPSSVSRRQKIDRLFRSYWRRSPRPPYRVIKPVFPASRWNLLFLFLPSGRISVSQHFTIQRLNSTGIPLLVVVATLAEEDVPVILREATDALIWKGLSGYDFSAYRIGLEEISSNAPGADLLVMNDSVFGPFGDIELLVANAPWGLTGFTSSAMAENHIQSYAFAVKSVDKTLLSNLSEAMLPKHSFNSPGDVILCQELALARVASGHTSVGSYWHSDGRTYGDPMLTVPLELLDAGLPFLKKSLLGKMQSFQDVEAIRERLLALGHAEID
ncbi:MAG: rhamnan synthesis F family protein [Aliihoeflea sp.]|uniref:rhamnan synthesis F family protein n=1 Tax=Aliihoeflea sp. TaxID=2608088 RepID=UPI004033EB3F